jgi:hypothetical protein
MKELLPAEKTISFAGSTMSVMGRLLSMLLERSDFVLWSLSPNGIVLHHLDDGIYLELDALGYLLWGLLDGGRTVEEVMQLSEELSVQRGIHLELAVVRDKMRQIISVLLHNRFVVEVEDDYR